MNEFRKLLFCITYIVYIFHIKIDFNNLILKKKRAKSDVPRPNYHLLLKFICIITIEQTHYYPICNRGGFFLENKVSYLKPPLNLNICFATYTHIMQFNWSIQRTLVTQFYRNYFFLSNCEAIFFFSCPDFIGQY